MLTLEELKRQSDELDRINRASMQTLEKATEEAKRQQWRCARACPERGYQESTERWYRAMVPREVPARGARAGVA